MLDRTFRPPTAPLSAFRPSPTNPRKRFTETAIRDLADSIAEHELLQPIVARPWPDAKPGDVPFEIVAGERRWRGCSLLTSEGRSPYGDQIPYLLRELTDAEVLEIQLVENIQREDLHPLEEAEHYQRMRTDPHKPASVEDISVKAKISTQRVYDRLTLLQLVDAAREAFLADRINVKLALQIARMPQRIQAELVEHLANWAGEPMAPKAAAAFIRERYMLRLVGAPFDPEDATLPGGSCGSCLKRTGSNPSLFGDVSDADTCTDTACFAERKAAAREREVAEWRDAGYTVLTGDEAKAATTPDGRHLAGGWYSPQTQVPANIGDPAYTVEQVLEKGHAPAKATCIIDHPAGTPLLQAVSFEQLERWLKKIKRHRDQLTRAAAEKAARQGGTEAEPADDDDDGGREVQSTTEQRPDDSRPGVQVSGETADGETLDAPAAEDDLADVIADLLTVAPPKPHAGKIDGLTPAQYQRREELRLLAILVTEAVIARWRDDATCLPSLERLAPMLTAALSEGSEPVLSFADLAQLLQVRTPDESGLGVVEWAAKLPLDMRPLLVVLQLALQASNGDDPFSGNALAIAQLMDIDSAPLVQQAHETVEQVMRVHAIQHGQPHGNTGKKVPVKYRNAETGDTWSGRGLKPRWLVAELDKGRSLDDFLVGGGE
ncbi:ParB/RepB/Spo0J family partition protein [Rubrivivax sp. JA1026]|uniref:ParB/RepB/Spo0J family partition protein n=1 Tax=Rubrivivax sp. JA1026 TaxID=2710888 RepID=UPI0013E92634|nr:ParB/RepB/Spo0J family partition protein [Rubrivivax sp. JA1026]